jgi:hypothetical protein
VGLAAVLAAMAMTAAATRVHAAAGVKLAQGGVSVWAPEKPFRGDQSPLPPGEGQGEGAWETIPPDKLPYATERPPVLASANLVAAIDGQKGVVAVYTREGNRTTKRGEVSMDGAGRFAKYKLVRDADQKRLGVEVYSAESRLLSAIYLTADGILEFRPGEAKGLSVGGTRLKYGIVPSFVGTDFVYTAGSAPGRCYLPPMNLFVGLVEGGDAMMVGVWPKGRQAASLLPGATSGVPDLGPTRPGSEFDGLALQTAGSSFFLTFIEKPGIWHAEPLRPAYVEKETAIAWKRPLEAKWIGHFFIASEEISYPFYFRYEPAKLWGRFIRGWFGWPMWFDGQRTMIHFEKRFPPRGELLIYFLEKHPRQPAAGLLAPVEVMEKALGKEEAAGLLDFDGVEERPLLKHGNAVCAMTNGMQKWFDDGQESQHVAQIERYCDDVADFIRMIRQRIEEYGAFAAGTKGFVQVQSKANPQLAGMAADLVQTLDEMEKIATNDVPRESLAEVRGWTDQMKHLAGQSGPGRNKLYEPLGAKCRSVAGTQDDLARALSILGIRLTEQAAKGGVASPAHAELAEAVIAKTRQVLRKPTWWEPRRQYWPKSDPGRP